MGGYVGGCGEGAGGKASIQATQGGRIDLDLQNKSSLSEGQVKVVRSALESQLKSQGLQLATEQIGGIPVAVTLSQDSRRFVWVAQFGIGEARQVEMVTAPLGLRPGEAPPLVYSIERTLLWSQQEPILDAAVVKDPGDPGPGLLVLDTEQLTLYRREGEDWVLQDKHAIAHAHPWPRDARGQIVTAGRTFDVHLPQLDCDGDAFKTIRLNCEEDEPNWVFGGTVNNVDGFTLAPGRNFFTERLKTHGEAPPKLEPFFSVAYVQDDDRQGTLYSSIDGRVHYYAVNEDEDQRSFQAQFAFQGWGSGLAAIQTSCADRWLVLATRPGDATTTDAIAAYDIFRSTTAPTATPVGFAGPVTALWTREEGDSAVVIVNNLTTRRYEAYSLRVPCGK